MAHKCKGVGGDTGYYKECKSYGCIHCKPHKMNSYCRNALCPITGKNRPNCLNEWIGMKKSSCLIPFKINWQEKDHLISIDGWLLPSGLFIHRPIDPNTYKPKKEGWYVSHHSSGHRACGSLLFRTISGAKRYDEYIVRKLARYKINFHMDVKKLTREIKKHPSFMVGKISKEYRKHRPEDLVQIAPGFFVVERSPEHDKHAKILRRDKSRLRVRNTR